MLVIKGLLARLAAAVLLAWLALPGAAYASCTTSSGAVDLGTANSFAVASAAQGASGATGFKCTGSGVLGLLMTNTVTATIAGATNSLGTQFRLHDASTGDYIPYTLCQEATCSVTYPIGSQIIWTETSLLGLLGLFNASDGSLPLYIRTTPGTQVAAGTYTSTINLSWSWHICDIGLVGLCLTEDTGTAASTVSVSLIVTQDCAIAAPSLDFGSAAFVGSFDPVTQTISIRCSKDAAYTVGISDGNNYSTSRRLAAGGNTIAYEIYFPASSTSRWGSVGAERRSSAEATTNGGTYTGTTEQTFTYKGQILSGQLTPPAGSYTDTLIVDVQF